MQTMTNYRSESRRTSDERGRPPLAARLSPLVTLLAVGTAPLFGAPGPAAWAAPVTITEQTPTPPAHTVRGAGGGTQASAALAAVRYTAKAPKLAADVQPSAAILQTAARRLSIVSKNTQKAPAATQSAKKPTRIAAASSPDLTSPAAAGKPAGGEDLKTAPAASDSRIRNFGIEGTSSATTIPIPMGARKLNVGESQVLTFRWVSKVAIGNPAVADVVAVSDNQVLVNGKTAGETNLFVWDRGGQHEYKVVVAQGTQDMAEVARLVSREFGHQDIKVQAINDTLFLFGQVKTQPEQQQAEAVAAAYTKNVKSFIQLAQNVAPEHPAVEVANALNQIFAGRAIHAQAVNDGTTVVLQGNATADQAEQARKVAQAMAKGVAVVDYFQAPAAGSRQVLVRSRVVDIDRVKSRELGIDWGPVFLQNGPGGILQRVVGEQPFQFGEARTGPLKLDQGGPLSRLDPIGFKLRALEQQNAARVLSEPNLLVMEGQKGGILIGGEIPIPVAQQSGTGAGTSITVEYKPFGIRLDVEVIAITDDGVNLRISPEVSALDYTNSVTVNGFNLPALRTRRADTIVHIRTGQTLAIGGLLQNDLSKQTKAIPLLSKIPVLGELFKDTRFQRGESELVILVTPELPGPDNSVSTPVPNVEIHRPSPDIKVR